MQQNRNKKQHENITVPRWGAELAGAMVFGFITGYILGQATDLVDIVLASIFGLGSTIFGLRALRDLIADAHIMALEVFYGHRRAVEKED